MASVPYAARPHRVTITPKQHCADLLQLDTEGEAIAELACVLQLVMEGAVLAFSAQALMA